MSAKKWRKKNKNFKLYICYTWMYYVQIHKHKRHTYDHRNENKSWNKHNICIEMQSEWDFIFLYFLAQQFHLLSFSYYISAIFEDIIIIHFIQKNDK